MLFRHATAVGVALTLVTNAVTAKVPTVEVAPGVYLPMITMGGVNATMMPNYPDYSNYSLWIELGGRGFDSAWEYRTQTAVATAIEQSGLPRESFFITTKIPGSLHGGCCGCPRDGIAPAAPSPPLGPEDFPPCIKGCHGVCFPKSGHYTGAQAKAYIEADLKALGASIKYIDLLLMHEPCDYIAPYPYNASSETAEIWAAMEDFAAENPGVIRAIGVSNFNAQMLEDLSTTAKVTPAVNQCRMSFGDYDKSSADYCTAHNITYQAYSPLHGTGISTNDVLSSVAASHNKTNFQVVMRWITQLGIPIVTASNRTSYDTEDLDIFDFVLSPAEISSITKASDGPPKPTCIPHKTCPAKVANCVMDGCQVCGSANDLSTGFDTQVAGVRGACASCGCTKCCEGCVEKKYGTVTYCMNP